MASGAVEIVNLALTNLGARVVMSLDDDVQEARVMKVLWDPSRKAILRMHPWNFAKRRVVLSPTTTTPAYGYTYFFNLPSDCIRVLGLEDNDDFKIEGRGLVTDDQSISLSYIADVTDTAQYDTLFDQALALHLAWSACKNITQETALKDQLWRDFLAVLKLAKFQDSTEDPAMMVQSDDFDEARIQFNAGAARVSTT